MFALLGILPILVAIVLMIFFKQKASIALVSAWATAFLLSIFVWNMNLSHAGTWTVFGFLSAINVLFIVFAAIFMLNALLDLKFIETIGNGFDVVTQDRRIQIIIIAWFFGAFIEGAAGFGTSQAIAAPLLVGLGISPYFAAVSALISNAGPVLFGAAGTPTTGGFDTINDAIILQYGVEYSEAIFLQLNNRIAFISMFVGSFVPFMMIATIVSRDGKKRGIRDALSVLPLCLFAGIIYGIPAWLVSFLGPQLPALVGALVGMPVFLLAIKFGFLVPKDIYRFQNDPVEEHKIGKKTDISQFMAWMPYALIVLILVLTRLPWLPFSQWLNPNPAHLSIIGLFGFEGINWNFNPLWNPGIFPFMPITILFLIIRNTKIDAVKKITFETLKQLKHAAVALFFGVALVQIMLNTNYSNPMGSLGAMTTEIAYAISTLFGGIYLIVAPFIGILGAFVSGSHTVANIMFYGLQMETSQVLEIPIVMGLVAQTFGAGVGNMVAINNIVAVMATTGYKGKESKLMAATFLPMLIYSLAISLTLYLLVLIGMNWIA